MERFVSKPRSALAWSAICNGAVAIAVLAFGAPPVILLPVNVVGMTFYSALYSRVGERRFDRR